MQKNPEYLGHDKPLSLSCLVGLNHLSIFFNHLTHTVSFQIISSHHGAVGTGAVISLDRYLNLRASDS